MPPINTSAVSLPSPAKLNLMLHITGRRDDGYHLLQTLFQLIGLEDRITLSLRHDGQVVLTHGIEGIPAHNNLITRAAQALKPLAAPSAGVSIRLDKHIPMGGGLGGGSSNAATTLLGLDRLWNLNLPPTQLADIGLTLGADVPVFLDGHNAWAEGVGEQLSRCDLPTAWYLVIHPGVEISTARVFKDPQLTRHSRPITMARALKGGMSEWRNDCESVVRHHYRSVDQALEWLSSFAPARLTGTGACVFASFLGYDQAHAVADRIPTGWQGWVVPGLSRSPLHDTLDRLYPT